MTVSWFRGDLVCAKVLLPFFRGARVLHRGRLGTCSSPDTVLWDGREAENMLPGSELAKLAKAKKELEKVEQERQKTSQCAER